MTTINPESTMIPVQDTGAQQPMMVVGRSNNKRPKYAAKMVRVLSIIQLLGGILTMIFFIPLCVYGSITVFSGAGIWVSIFWILAGSFGIASSKSKSVCMIRTYMVMCILGAVFISVIFSMTVVSFIVDQGNAYREHRYSYNYYYHDYYYPDKEVNGTTTTTTTTTTTRPPFLQSEPGRKFIGMTVLNSLTMIIILVELITLIWGSALACKVGCCCSGNNENIAVPVQYINGQPYVIIGQNQHFLAPVSGGPSAPSQPIPMPMPSAQGPMPPTYDPEGYPEKRHSPPPSYQ